MISGSSLSRVKLCPVSEVLPHRNTISKDAERGSAVHAFLADVPTMGRDEALTRVDEKYRLLCEIIDLGKLPASNPGAFAPEIAFVWNTAKGEVRELGQSLGRNYGKLSAAEIPCTLDNVGISSDGETAIVTDYKGGWSNADPAFENMQLRFGALCFCRAKGLKRAHISIIRIKEDGQSWYDSAELTEWDLDVIEGQVAHIVDSVTEAQLASAQGQRLTPTTGEHCRYCPAYASCPAVTSLAVAVSGGELGVELTRENAAIAWQRIKDIKRMVKEAEESVREFAAIEPIDLGGGKVLGEVVGERDSISGGVAYRVVKEMYGEDAADEACKMTSTKAAIERAIKPIVAKGGGKFAPANREVLKRIGEIGGIHKKRTRSVKEHKAKLIEQ